MILFLDSFPLANNPENIESKSGISEQPNPKHYIGIPIKTMATRTRLYRQRHNSVPFETEVSSWSNYLAQACALNLEVLTNAPLLFRGQGSSEWGLVPSLVRVLYQAERRIKHSEAIATEELAREEFAAQAHLYLSSAILASAPTCVHWWMHMQHYQAPTRLLDWTYSPYVAAYFACCEYPDREGAVWMLNTQADDFSMPKEFNDHPTQSEIDRVNKIFESDDTPGSLHFINMGLRNERMIAQQGVFLLSSNVQARHDEVLLQLRKKGKNEQTVRKLRIPAKLKREFLCQLYVMNIHARSLFPGADGLGMSIGEIIRFRGMTVAQASFPNAAAEATGQTPKQIASERFSKYVNKGRP